MATLRMLFALFFATAASLKAPTSRLHPTWAPQDLTRDNPGFAPIPDNDYVKQYERNRALWPVEFFVIVYRRIRGGAEVLVRRSANGTSKYGVGTGAPATRWILASQEAPPGYAKTGLSFAASNFPEFEADVDWTYDKIDICADAFAGQDPELEAFAGKIRDGLIEHLAARSGSDAWEKSTPVWKSKFYGAFVLNHRVVLHAIDATPARWRGDAGSSPLDEASTAASSPRKYLMKNCRVHPTHWLISTQVHAVRGAECPREAQRPRGDPGHAAHERRLFAEGDGRSLRGSRGCGRPRRVCAHLHDVPADAVADAGAHRDARGAAGGDGLARRAHEAERS
jgi:hypothetical protein